MATYLDWNPGLDNAHLTMQQVIDSLPGNPPKAIHKLVRLFENPQSPLAFKGAIDLPRHDCVHVMLGRGLSPQDEAFVIGFTMGTSKSISRIEVKLFELIAKHVYPPIYKFNNNHLKVFEMGIDAGKKTAAKQIYDFPFERHMDETLGELRDKIGLSVEELKTVYRLEQQFLPNTTASKRLPV